MSKDLITGEIAIAIHLLEPTSVRPQCVVHYIQSASQHGYYYIWDRVASLPQIVMAWQLGFLLLDPAYIYI